MISQCVRTKSSTQYKVFFSKARKCLGLDMMHPGSCSGGASLSDNCDGGGGADTEDASLVENGSGVKSGCKTDDDLSLSSSKAVQTETSPVGTINILPDAGKSKKIINAGELVVIVDEPEDVSAGSKKNSSCLVLDGDNNSDGSESLAVKILEKHSRNLRAFLFIPGINYLRKADGSSYKEGSGVFEIQRQQIELVMKSLQSVYIPGWRFLPTKNRRMKELNTMIQSSLGNIIGKKTKAMQAGDSSSYDLLGILLESISKEQLQMDQEMLE